MYLIKLSRKRDLLSLEHCFSFLIIAENEHIGSFFSLFLPLSPAIYISPVSRSIHIVRGQSLSKTYRKNYVLVLECHGIFPGFMKLTIINESVHVAVRVEKVQM